MSKKGTERLKLCEDTTGKPWKVPEEMDGDNEKKNSVYGSKKLKTLLTKLASLSSPVHRLMLGPTAEPASMPQNTSTIIAKP